MKPPMLHTAYKVVKTRNKYGDYTASGSVALKCHFRYITQSVDGGNEQINSDAMAWFETSSDIARRDIILFAGNHYRVERVTHARRLRETAIQFIKVELKHYGVIS